ncbi:CARDB domain-containing protein [Nocardioides terrisoli]|uniref:CARDB domain-containing protein n=1 Tax=Nocardioides terrisoli TaxID=3388267 RepID=UPI00287BC8E7|nr:CARDB domain-containing protein [Nocardioides marmorisolisilvae]
MFPASTRRATRALALAIGAVTAATLAITAAQASTPEEGSVSDTGTVTSWGGGPFVAANVTAQVNGTPDCSVPQSCDDFTLHVSTPAGYDTGHELKIDVSWTNSAADFDVYVLDASGNLVGTAASSADPEEVVLPPTTGTYTVRVVPFAPLGESYSATAALVATPADSPPGTDTPPGFHNYTAPSSFTDANNAGEPSIGTNWKSDATLFQSYLSTYKVDFDDSVSPARAAWSDVSATASNGCPQGGTTSLDPILFTDHATGRTFESQLSGQDSLTCWTDDDGATWFPSQGGGIPSGVDHQTIGGGPFSAGGVGALPTSTYPNAVYYCSQDIATAFCATSRDGGTTFGPGVSTYSLLDCGGLHGHVKVAPDGTAYLPNKGCGNNAAVVTSTDDGSSWTVHKVPGSSTSDADPSVGIGANGTTYFGYVGSDGRPAVAVSHDRGETWSTPQHVGTEFGINNAVFPAMVAGDDDRAALAFIGTPTDGNYQDAANFDGVWHLYVATTYDGGKTWQTSDATPNDPVQRGSICTGGTTCGSDRNLLDFIDATVDRTGHIEVAYADGCIKTCVTDASETSGAGPADAQAAYATIARQSSGMPLFSQYDPTTNLTLSSLNVSDQSGQFVAKVGVTNSGNQPVDAFDVQVLDNRKPVGDVGTSLDPGRSTTLTFRWKATGGGHTVTAVVDPLNLVTESDESDNKQVQVVTQ